MDAFRSPSNASRIDVAFSVPMVHRLRFTSDCFGADWDVVRELIEPTIGGHARVQVWLDSGLAGESSAALGNSSFDSLAARIEHCIAGESSTMRLTDPVQILPGGEEVKNDPAAIESILTAINRSDLDRRSYVIVIGGGAVLDAVGFAAAIAHRGIRLIRFPTTTLAQADSGVGVKNAVNLFRKKNWKGTFATPWAVVNDSLLLEGLSDRDFRCGFSEAVKVSLLKSPAAFQRLCESATRIANRDMPAAIDAIRHSVLMHMQHITRGGDPFEMLEARPLDFGHWSAHKLEALTAYEVRHGEAVAIGVATDVIYSHLKFGLPETIVDQTLKALVDLQLPIFHPALSGDVIFDGLEEFRQHLGGQLTLTMLRRLGDAFEVHEVDRAAMAQAFEIARQRQPELGTQSSPTDTPSTLSSPQSAKISQSRKALRILDRPSQD